MFALSLLELAAPVIIAIAVVPIAVAAVRGGIRGARARLLGTI